MFRDASLGHRLLLALGRVVSTKVYLSSKGRDETVKQSRETWRQRFLQRGMQGTAILFGNGSSDDAMRSFPPSQEVCQDSFVAVFTGPEEPTQEQSAVMEGTTPEARKAQDAMARSALRKEVELQVQKDEFDQQARRLKATNYVYAEAQYREDLVEKLPAARAVPEVFEACAKFVQVDKDTDDVTRAEGPANSTVAGKQARDAEEGNNNSVPWMSVIEDNMAEISELSQLPALQMLLEMIIA